MNYEQLMRRLINLPGDAKENMPTCMGCGFQQLEDGDPVKSSCPSCGGYDWELREEK